MADFRDAEKSPNSRKRNEYYRTMKKKTMEKPKNMMLYEEHSSGLNYRNR